MAPLSLKKGKRKDKERKRWKDGKAEEETTEERHMGGGRMKRNRRVRRSDHKARYPHFHMDHRRPTLPCQVPKPTFGVAAQTFVFLRQFSSPFRHGPRRRIIVRAAPRGDLLHRPPVAGRPGQRLPTRVAAASRTTTARSPAACLSVGGRRRERRPSARPRGAPAASSGGAAVRLRRRAGGHGEGRPPHFLQRDVCRGPVPSAPVSLILV